MLRSSRFSLGAWLFVLAFPIVAYFARGHWLPWLVAPLIYDEGPTKADIAVVLAGDYHGDRIQRAAQLVRQGYVPAVLVDGPTGFYGENESTLAIRYIVAKGYPAAWFIDFPIHATSTQQEANLVVPELRRRNVRSYLLVTSEFHSGRAGRIFRATQKAMGYDAVMRVVTAPSPEYGPDNWWRVREGKKAAFIEWAKTFGTALGQ